ncbi:hypothetical protein ES703_62202 [subsurface metagenome]
MRKVRGEVHLWTCPLKEIGDLFRGGPRPLQDLHLQLHLLSIRKNHQPDPKEKGIHQDPRGLKRTCPIFQVSEL